MRIVGEVPHPAYKISILHNMGRFIIKFESNSIEQSYKIRESDTIKNADDVKQLISNSLLSKIDKVFLEMSDNYLLLTSQDSADNIPLVDEII